MATSCGFPFSSCERDFIEATLPAILTATTPTSILLANRIAETNLDPPSFAQVEGIVRGQHDAVVGFIFTLEAFDTPVRTILSMIVTTPVQPGDTLVLRGTFSGGGWGITQPPSGADILVDFRRGDDVGRGATGTAVVLDASPLRLRLDFFFDIPGGARLQGDLAFRTLTEDVSCS